MPPTLIAKGDSAATSHYWRNEDTACLKNIRNVQGPSVTLPNNVAIASNRQGQLSLNSKLSLSAQKATILPNLKSSSLISLGQLCDDDCEILLNKKRLYVVKDKDVILQGHRNYDDGLWDIPLNNESPLQASIVNPKTHAGLYTITGHRSHQSLRKKIPLPATLPNTDYTTFNNIFHGIDGLIDEYSDYATINQQIRSDRK